MTCSNATLLGSLLVEIERIDDGKLPIMEICRRIGDAADDRGLTRPSYEQVRVHVQATRRLRRISRARILAEIALDVRPPTALVDELVQPPLKR